MNRGAAVFDVMGTLFDLAPLRERLGAAVLEAWFERILHSATALTLAGEFAPFAELARSAFAVTAAKLDVDAEADEILPLLRELPPFPDARPALDRLAEAGLRIVTLTNGGEDSTRTLLERGGLADRVEQVLTTEHVRAYKPDPRPYLLAAERVGLPPERLTLVAAHGWDVVGARAAGLRAVWVDRLEHAWPFPDREPGLRAPDLERAAELVLRT